MPPEPTLIRRSHSTAFRLNHFSVGNKIGGLLSNSLSELPQIEHLDLTDNRLSQPNIITTMTSLQTHVTLRSLSLASNKLTRHSLASVCQTIESCRSLTALNLSNTQLSDRLGEKIAKCLQSHLGMKKVDLSHNLLGEHSGEALATMISDNYNIAELNLQWNGIRRKGASAICEALKKNSSLTSLNVGWNKFGDAGGTELGLALPGMKGLRLLDLTNNQIGTAAATVIASGLRRNQSISRLYLDSNPVGVVGGQALLLAMNDLPADVELISLDKCNFTLQPTEPDVDEPPPTLAGPDAEGGDSGPPPPPPQEAGTFKPFPTKPRDYAFDLARPFDRALMEHVLRLVKQRPGYKITELKLDSAKLHAEPETFERPDGADDGRLDHLVNGDADDSRLTMADTAAHLMAATGGLHREQSRMVLQSETEMTITPNIFDDPNQPEDERPTKVITYKTTEAAERSVLTNGIRSFGVSEMLRLHPEWVPQKREKPAEGAGAGAEGAGGEGGGEAVEAEAEGEAPVLLFGPLHKPLRRPEENEVTHARIKHALEEQSKKALALEATDGKEEMEVLAAPAELSPDELPEEGTVFFKFGYERPQGADVTSRRVHRSPTTEHGLELIARCCACKHQLRGQSLLRFANDEMHFTVAQVKRLEVAVLEEKAAEMVSADQAVFSNSKRGWYEVRELPPRQGLKKPAKKAPPKVEKPKWTLPMSVWAPRLTLSESKDFYDSDKVWKRSFKTDWRRMWRKPSFRNLILRACGGNEKEVEEIKEEIQEDYRLMVRCFEYYACASGGDGFMVKLNAYSDFLDDCCIPQEKVIDEETGEPKETDANGERIYPMSRSALDTIFLACNLEVPNGKGVDDRRSSIDYDADNKQNDDRSLMRFEFVEALMRIALAKFIPEGTPPEEINASEVIDLLLQRHIVRHLSDNLEDKNDYREKTLYCEAISNTLKPHVPVLREIHSVLCKTYPKSGKKAPSLTIKEWMDFVDSLGLFDTSFTKREGRLVFSWSQMRVADELKKRKDYVTMPFVDMLEALPRVAQLKALPTDDMLDRWGGDGRSSVYEGYQNVNAEKEQEMQKYEEEHGHERPLEEKCAKLIELIFTSLHPENNPDPKHLTIKMLKERMASHGGQLF
eukprot:g140.t1